MKKIFLAAVPAIALLAFSVQYDPIPIGAPLPHPEVKMKEVTGTEISFSDAQKENGLLVVFSCNTCPVVKKYQSRTNEVCSYALEKGVGVILLNPNEAYRNNGDSFDDMKNYSSKNKFSWYYAVDKNSFMADAFGAKRTPELFLFNKEGKLVYHGAVDDNANGPEQVTRKHAIIAIDELITGRQVSLPETRSVGCSIKRL